MKKVIVSAVSLLILCENFYTPAVAGQSSPTVQTPSVPFFDQGRFGLGIAAEYMSSDTELNIVATRDIKEIASKQSQVGKKAQPAISAEIGGLHADVWYLGFIASWHYSEASNSARSPIRSANYFSHDFRIKQYADFMLKPGYKLTPNIMIYALVGPTLADWTHTTTQFATIRVVDKFRIHKTSFGLGCGGGFEVVVQKRHGFSFDYTYHILSSASKNQFVRYSDGVIREGDMLRKVQPSFATIAVRYTYFFSL